MKKSETMSKSQLMELSSDYDSVYWNNATNKVARLEKRIFFLQENF